MDTQNQEPEVKQKGAGKSRMWQALNDEFDYVRPRRGDIRTGTVVRVDDDQLIVDIGAKTEGIVQSQDLAKLAPEYREQLRVGTEVPVYVLRPETQEGDVILSINMARALQDWDRAAELLESGEIIEVEVTGYNKGGLIAEFGELQGFVPHSHIVNLKGQAASSNRPDRLSELVGSQIPVRVIEVNRRQRRLILSERSARRQWRSMQKQRLMEHLEPGMIVKGTVSNLADFGAFVDLGGADGLIHISELSWDRVRHPREALEVGQEVEVYVLRVDRERKRIGLSLKRHRPDPWTEVESKYYVGQLVQGTITNLTDFGAFAWIEEGVEGLVHISELSDVNISHPRNVVSRQDVVTLQIISINAEKRRMGLSLRRVPEPLRREHEVPEAAEVHEPAVSEEPMADVASIEAIPTVAESPEEQPSLDELAESSAPPPEPEAVAPSVPMEETASGQEVATVDVSESDLEQAIAAETVPQAGEEGQGEEVSGPGPDDAAAEGMAEAELKDTAGMAVDELAPPEASSDPADSEVTEDLQTPSSEDDVGSAGDEEDQRELQAIELAEEVG